MKLVRRSTIKNVASASANFFVYQKIVFGLVLLTLGFLILKIYFSNQLAISGAAVNYSERKAEILEKENYELENQISLKSTLGYIESRAKEMGLVKVSKIESLKPISPVAIKQ